MKGQHSSAPYFMVALLATVLALSGCGGDVRNIRFNATEWRRANAIENHRTVRSQMVKDLLRRHNFTGWTRAQVFDVLGEPAAGEPTKMGFPQWNTVYILGMEQLGPWSLDNEALGFKFDNSDKVVSYGLSVN